MFKRFFRISEETKASKKLLKVKPWHKLTIQLYLKVTAVILFTHSCSRFFFKLVRGVFLRFHLPEFFFPGSLDPNTPDL